MDTFTSINGSENAKINENSKLNALIKFYKAFNQGDLNLMKTVWLNSNEASMNNPVGGIMRGWNNIEKVYDKIFNGTADVFVEFYDFSIHASSNMFLVTGRERGHFKKGNTSIKLTIRTSRVFILENGEWKQIQHHGSIDNPELLKSYQNAVLSN